jgi:hypothetical protein
MSRVNALGWPALAFCAIALLTACSQAPNPTATLAPTSTPDHAATSAAATAGAIQVAQRQEAEIATGIAATLTAQPTATPTETDTPVPSDTPTATRTATKAPTSTPAVSATPSRTPGPTQPPVTSTPTTAPAPASVYGTTGGAAGYASDIRCTYSGGVCVPSMPAGDISFEFLLGSAADTPLTLFEKYGLSVERDGANVADMFMFVDAGLLAPDSLVWFGSSRTFSTPGRYVVRSSGCLTTVPAPCGWNTIPGTTVTFVIK